MDLKTYRAPTMAEALAEVRKELGKEAVILHTRSFRVGSLLGLGGRSMVEITASNARLRPLNGTLAEAMTPAGSLGKSASVVSVDAASTTPVSAKPNGTYAPTRPLATTPSSPFTMPGGARPGPGGARSETPARTEGNEGSGVVVPRALRPGAAGPTPPHVPSAPAQRVQATTVRPDPQTARATHQIEAELASLKRMMAHLMHAQRGAATGGPKAGGLMPEPLFALFTRMLDNEVAPEIADQIAGEVRDELTADELTDEMVVRQTVLRRIEQRIPTRFERPAEAMSAGLGPRVIALVGPTGVGKTTTVAKLAATFKIRYGLSIGLITADTYRIAAVEQLKTYADIIEVPIRVANTPAEVREARVGLGDVDVIVVDSAGRSQRDAARLEELRSILDAASPDETHLVLSAAVAPSTLADIADRFMVLRPDRMILTKLDEAAAPGVLVGLPARVGLPFSYVTTGQEVPDDIEPARAPRLARMVLADSTGSGGTVAGGLPSAPAPGGGAPPHTPQRANDARASDVLEEESA